MKTLRCIAAALLLASTAASLPAQSTSTDERMTQAVLDVYARDLEAHPHNYKTLFRRANLYYGRNDFEKALADISEAIEYTPKGDRDQLGQSYGLRSGIYQALKRPQEALADISRACEFDSKSFAFNYQKANLEYELGDYAAAKDDYRKLERMRPRSLEALVGLARVAVKENNLGVANEYIDRAVALYPTDPEVYMRRARVRELIGNTTGAVDDLLSAYRLDPTNNKPLNALVKIADVDYNAVSSALGSAIARNPEQGALYYIRASVARAHYHYSPALEDYLKLLDNKMYESAGVYAAIAQCYYALCDFDNALTQINFAIGYTAANAPYKLICSQIYLAKGAPEMALINVERCLDKLPDNNEAMMQKGLCQYAMGLYDDAQTSFGEAIVTSPQIAENYLLRAWALKAMGRDEDAAKFLRRCIDLAPDSNSIHTLRGFALLALGDTDGAREWIDTVMAAHPIDVDGHIAYRAACLYAWLGDYDTAFDQMRNALDLGYANLYQWRNYNVANLNVAPLRDMPRFESLLNAHHFLFKIPE